MGQQQEHHEGSSQPNLRGVSSCSRLLFLSEQTMSTLLPEVEVVISHLQNLQKSITRLSQEKDCEGILSSIAQIITALQSEFHVDHEECSNKYYAGQKKMDATSKTLSNSNQLGQEPIEKLEKAESIQGVQEAFVGELPPDYFQDLPMAHPVDPCSIPVAHIPAENVAPAPALQQANEENDPKSDDFCSLTFLEYGLLSIYHRRDCLQQAALSFVARTRAEHLSRQYRFNCSYCGFRVQARRPVYMCHDRCFCSQACRQQGSLDGIRHSLHSDDDVGLLGSLRSGKSRFTPQRTETMLNSEVARVGSNEDESIGESSEEESEESDEAEQDLDSMTSLSSSSSVPTAEPTARQPGHHMKPQLLGPSGHKVGIQSTARSWSCLPAKRLQL
eukprot:gnl/MRDRNA2_/MRDRNA2_33505_c0_seq1.p1 gnl/MRDRNA2_/MRDRNA2_33505_c0~~gnl/MRDRNA2_/MRDRNA2_33505_c0_seq1.p1  ORF type:complete len:388 (+),score=61.16 gnl/MRDRNA2_/MRDRNA2_33505_c0_seq1:137-1300(+)